MHIFKIWSIRFQLLFGLKKYTELLDEMTSFEDLDAPDLFFQYHDDKKEGKDVSSVFLLNSLGAIHPILPHHQIPVLFLRHI